MFQRHILARPVPAFKPVRDDPKKCAATASRDTLCNTSSAGSYTCIIEAASGYR